MHPNPNSLSPLENWIQCHWIQCCHASWENETCIANRCSLVKSRGGPSRFALKYTDGVVWGKLALSLPVLHLSWPPAKMTRELDGLGWYRTAMPFTGMPTWPRRCVSHIQWRPAQLNWGAYPLPPGPEPLYFLVFPWSCNHLSQWEPRWLAGTISLEVTGGLLVAVLLVTELPMSSSSLSMITAKALKHQWVQPKW